MIRLISHLDGKKRVACLLTLLVSTTRSTSSLFPSLPHLSMCRSIHGLFYGAVFMYVCLDPNNILFDSLKVRQEGIEVIVVV